MRALDRKLMRDLGRMKGQVFSIALVVASGIATYVGMVTTYQSLVSSRDTYYAEARLADVFAAVTRAPETVVDRLRRLPGVAWVEGRVVAEERLEIPGFAEVVRGRFVSLPEGPPGLNRLYLRRGRLPERDDEVVVGEAFALAHRLQPGMRLTALFTGRRTPLRIVGIATSPEYLWVIGSGAIFGDDLRYGVLWMRHRALAAAEQYLGEVNDLTLALAPGASAAEVIDQVDRLLEPYGSHGAHDRSKQTSTQLVNQELQQLETSATWLPAIFLGVAAFLLNVLLSRVVGTQREQLATLKAVGYPNRAIAVHYLKLALVVVLVGALLGVGVGGWVGSAFVQLYTRFFRFPVLEYHLAPSAAAWAVLLSTLAAVVGAAGAVRRAVRVVPAEAMRPEPPASFRPTVFERLGLDRLLPVGGRMVLRDLERQPLRTALSVLGIALATAILVAGNMGFDSMERVIVLQFEETQREELAVSFDTALPRRVVHTLQRTPGVLRAEPRWSVPVRLRAGPHSRETLLTGQGPDTTLFVLRDPRGRPVQLPPEGLALSRVLADRLGVTPGEAVELELLEDGTRRRVPVAALIDDLVGTAAYMREDALARLMGRAPMATQVLLGVDRPHLDAAIAALRRYPRVAAISRRQNARDQFQRQIADTFLTMQVGLGLFAAIIAVGVVYNNARIALAVRSRELATLRILGFERREVSAILLGEQAVQLGLGVPVGILLGNRLGEAVFSMTDPELFRIPALISGRTAAGSAIIVLLAGALSAWWVRRRANRLDLIGVLKARD